MDTVIRITDTESVKVVQDKLRFFENGLPTKRVCELSEVAVLSALYEVAIRNADIRGKEYDFARAILGRELDWLRCVIKMPIDATDKDIGEAALYISDNRGFSYEVIEAKDLMIIVKGDYCYAVCTTWYSLIEILPLILLASGHYLGDDISDSTLMRERGVNTLASWEDYKLKCEENL